MKSSPLLAILAVMSFLELELHAESHMSSKPRDQKLTSISPGAVFSNATVARGEQQEDSRMSEDYGPMPAHLVRYLEEINKNTQVDDTRIPVWNIAHMVNSIEQLDHAIYSGANGIETDVTFANSGVPTAAYHGFPCDCGRHCYHNTNFELFIRYLAKVVASPDNGLGAGRLQLLMLDLKLKKLDGNHKSVAGYLLASVLHRELFSRYSRKDSIIPPIRVIVSINHTKDYMLVRAFNKYMRDNQLHMMARHVGFDVGMNDEIGDIKVMWDAASNETMNVWQGDGLTNCANIVRRDNRLKEALGVRNNRGPFKKVYYWTADVVYHIRSVLQMGVDAIVTNQPRRVLQVLNEPELKRIYRLATAFDDPFTQYTVKPLAWKRQLPTISDAIETIANIGETTNKYVKSLPAGIAAALSRVARSFAMRHSD